MAEKLPDRIWRTRINGRDSPILGSENDSCKFSVLPSILSINIEL